MTGNAKPVFNRTVHPEYRRWLGMKERCYNPNHSSYKNYGAKGIKVCDRWLGKDGFYNFIEDMGEKPDGATLDRIDNSKDYEPANCKWASYHQQAANRKNSNKTVGVFYDKNSRGHKKWYAQLIVNGVIVLRKRYLTQNEASDARLKAQQEYGII